MAFTDLASDGLIRHNVSLMRFDAQLRRQIKGQLRTMQNSLTGSMSGLTFAQQASAARLQGLISQADDIIKGSYKGMNSMMLGEMQDLAGAEQAFGTQQLNKLFGVDIISPALTPSALRVLAKDSNIFGAPAAEHWGRQSAAMRRRFADEMRQGFLLGESTQDLVRRVRGSATGARQIVEIGGKARSVAVFEGGIMDVTTREASALVRTSINSVANEARLATYMGNTDVVGSVQAQVTLDTKTSDICQSHGNRPDEWTLPDFEPVGSSNTFTGPPPWHFNCRSSLLPVTKSWEELQKQGNAAGATSKQRSIARKLDNNAPKATRASMNGQVAKNLGYGDWLRTQPASVQLEALGPGKRKLWKAGKLNLTQTLDQSGRPLTLAEIKATPPGALQKSGASIVPQSTVFSKPLANRPGRIGTGIPPPPAPFVPSPNLSQLVINSQFRNAAGQTFKVVDFTTEIVGGKKIVTGLKAVKWNNRTGKFVGRRNATSMKFPSVKPPPPPPAPPPRPPKGGGKVSPPKPPPAQFVDPGNYRALDIGDIFSDTAGNVWKVAGKNNRGLRVVPWSAKSGRFLSPRNGSTFGFKQGAATVQKFKKATATISENLQTALTEMKTTRGVAKITRAQAAAVKRAIGRMSEDGFSSGIAKLFARLPFRAKLFNLGKTGNLTSWGGRAYSGKVDGAYWPGTKHLGLKMDLGNARLEDVLLHEFGHHLEFTLFKKGGIAKGRTEFFWKPNTPPAIKKALQEVDEAYIAMQKEYRARSTKVREKILNLRKGKGPITEAEWEASRSSVYGRVGRDAPSGYSLYNSEEWFAEAHMKYFFGGRSFLRMYLPDTHKFFETLFRQEGIWEWVR